MSDAKATNLKFDQNRNLPKANDVPYFACKSNGGYQSMTINDAAAENLTLDNGLPFNILEIWIVAVTEDCYLRVSPVEGEGGTPSDATATDIPLLAADGISMLKLVRIPQAQPTQISVIQASGSGGVVGFVFLTLSDPEG
jgi:hypothetical protein